MNQSETVPNSPAGWGGRLFGWIDARFPLSKLWRSQVSEYYAPINFNFWYFFGSIALLVLVNQIVTGIFLAMSYQPNAHLAFSSVQYIMRDVHWGWLIRYLHTTGASLFFAVIYLHMFRGLLYGSYKKPRELLWIIGMLIYVCLMAEAFMGYLLPWGQMSYWGAVVITSLFGAIPWIGSHLEIWIRGDFGISGDTLNRFFALHVVAIPILLLFLVVCHLMALHEVGSNNPDGIEIHENLDADGKPVDGVPFHPYYTVKDLFGVGVFLVVFALIAFYAPTLHGLFIERNNFKPADFLQTPPDIRPLWYFTPYYAILRSFPNKDFGVSAFALSVILLFLMPWIDRHPIKSFRYRAPMYRILLGVFVATFLFLGYVGIQPATLFWQKVGLRISELYFLFFVTAWVYAHRPGRRALVTTFGIALAVVLLIDWRFYLTSIAPLIWRTLVIPVAYLVVFYLIPLLWPDGLRDRAVPARVTFR
jgi:ubiquinol-cytochrome c reductase cytochrome b subunit